MTAQSVLLVSSNSNTIGTLAGILSPSGFGVYTAGSVDDAWAGLQSGGVALVVLDMTSPTMDEVALVRAVRSSVAYGLAPMLFLVSGDFQPPAFSSFGGEYVRDGWLSLPCPANQFLTLVKQLLQQSTTARPAPLPAQAQAAPPAPVPTADPAGADSAVLAGDLSLFDVTKILGVVEPLKLTGVLTVKDEKRLGLIYFVEGAVWHSTLAEIEGPDALFLLFHLKRGAFRFEKDEAIETRTIQGNTMMLLLEGLRQMDEAKALIQQFQQKRKQQAPAPSGQPPA